MILTRENVKSIDIDFEIDRKIKSGRLEELLIIVPTNRKLRQLKKELISLSPNSAVTKINIETIGTLSQKLLHNRRRFFEMSEAAAAVFIRQSIAENELEYFSQYRGDVPQGTQDRIRNVISEYKKHGITPEILDAEINKLEGAQKLKASDISAVYKSYINRSFELATFETGDVYRELIFLPDEEFEKSFDEIYGSVDLVVVFGFDEFTYPEIKIFSKCSEIENVKLFLSFDYYAYNDLIFSHLDKCYQQISDFGFNKITDLREVRESRFIRTARERLFKKLKGPKAADFKDDLVQITAPEKEKEVHLIAKEIKLLLERGAAPENISVAFNQVNNYAPLVRDIFKVYGIPVNLTDRLALSSSPVVNSVLNFLEILENDYYHKNIFRSVGTGFAEVEGLDVSSLQAASVNLRIISGRKNWLSGLNEAVRDFEPEENFARQNINVYRKALESFKLLEGMLRPFETKLTIDEFTSELKCLMVKLKVPVVILEDSSGREEENIKALNTFLDMSDEIFKLLKIEAGEDKKYSLTYFLDHLRTACSRARYNIKEKSAYGVLVTSVNEIRGLNFDYLFLGGLNDGDFPTRYSPEIFFSGSFQRKEIIHQTEERYHFYQALGSWRKKLYLATALRDGDRELESSIFLKEFLSLFEVTEKDSHSYTGRVFSEEEYLRYVGQSILRQNEFEIKDIDFKNIKKAIEIGNIRKSKEPGSEFAGTVAGDNDEITSRLEKLKQREYSVSQLETYARCPFKFFLERILGIQPIEEPAEEIEALEVGNILHSLLFDFYVSLREKNIRLQECSDNDFKEAEKILFDLAERYLADQLFTLPLSFIEKEKIFGEENSRKNSLLYKFLEAERKDSSGMLPKYFEVAFGSIGGEGIDTDLKSGSIKIGNVKLRGKVDRVEINEETGEFNVVDYKTGGRKPTANDLFDGISLQLPVYLIAIGQVLKDSVGREFTPKDMSIYSLKYSAGDFGKKNIKLSRKKTDPPELREELLRSVEENIDKYVTGISEGRFGLSELDDRESKICCWCGFNSVCRVTETEE